MRRYLTYAAVLAASSVALIGFCILFIQKSIRRKKRITEMASSGNRR